MSSPRPTVSVVVPFAGTREDAAATLRAMAALALRPGDDAVLADNTPAHVARDLPLPPGWRVVHAPGEGSPARARNAGALSGGAEWILFVDSDCHPLPDLLDVYLARPVDPAIGLVAGRIDDAPAATLAGRWAATRAALDQAAVLGSAAGPWAHTANLLVRREVWRGLGGFLEGILNAEDVDFCWRAQEAGWALAYDDAARVEHAHRASVRGLWRQRRIQAASARWVHRRWPERPAPPLPPLREAPRSVAAALVFVATGRLERGRFKLLDALVVLAAHAGDLGANRAQRHAAPTGTRMPLQLWCDQFPVVSETFVVGEARELQALGHPVEVLASRRPDAPALGVADLAVGYLEDDTRTERAAALARLVARHPLGCLQDRLLRRRWAREEGIVPLRALAPAILRLGPDTRVHVHFAAGAALNALRANRILGGRRWSLTAHAYDIYLLPRNLRAKLEAARVVTSGCDYTVRDLRELGGEDRVHRIVMGVDPDRFARSTPYDADGTVVAVGRLVEKKGFVHLVRAAAEPGLREHLTRLTIVGDGPAHDELQAEIARLGLEDVVVLAGRAEADEVRAALEEAAVLAMPCVVAANGDRDSMPVVVKEALAMEVPVVVSDEVGLSELVRPEFARAAPPGDHVALAAALAELLAKPTAERAEMGRAGRAFVRGFANLATESARLSALLEELR